MVQIQRSSGNGMSFDLKKPLQHHHMDLSAHSALSHYTSQMGMKAMAEASRYGGHTAPGPPTPSTAVGPQRSTITDFFGKMMSFSSCQTPVLPTYYQNAMYSTEKLESHLWFQSHFVGLHDNIIIFICGFFVKNWGSIHKLRRTTRRRGVTLGAGEGEGGISFGSICVTSFMNGP